MKKKVLFALIALFSFLSSWAADVTVGDYTVTIATQYVALTDAATGVTAPEITALKKGAANYFTAVTKMTLVDESGNLVDKTAIKTAGKYTWVINFSDGQEAKVLKVPFYVAVPATSNFDIVWNAATWADANADGHGLKLYYADYPWADYGWWHNGWDENTWNKLGESQVQFTKWGGNAAPSTTDDWERRFVKSWITAINCIDRSWKERTQDYNAVALKTEAYDHEYLTEWNGDAWVDKADADKRSADADADAYAALSEEGGMPSLTWKESGYPWYVFYTGTNTSKFVPAFVYTEGANTYYDIAKYANGDLVSFGPDGSAYLIMSGLFADAGYPLTLNVNNKNGEVNDADAYAAKLANLKVLLIPDGALTATVENATVLPEADVTIACNNLPYIGAEQKPAFSGENFNATVTYTPATSEAITLVEGRDFEAVYDATGDDYKSVGTHNFTVNFIGAYAGSKAATYAIEKAHVNINLAYIYKTYGAPDPTDPADFNFEIDASTPLKGADVKSDIAKYLVFQRASGDQNVGEDVKEYEYYYGKTADFEEKCNYSISFLQTKSLLIIQPKEVTINVTPVYKEYHKTVELKYDAEALKDQLDVEADKAKASGTPGATDLITSITWEGAGTDAGEAVNADLTGTAPNQTVEFRNQEVGGYPMTATAAIVPATKKSNYNVTVAIPELGFAIVPTTTADLTVEVPATEANGAVQVNGVWKFVYNGKFQKPAPVVKDGTVTLNPETDYDVTYENNQDAGTATCKVTLKGSYASSLTKSENFTINKADLVVKPVSSTSASEANWTVAYEGFQNRQASATDATPTEETATSEYARKDDHSYFSVDPNAITVKKGAEIEQDVYVLEIQLPTGVTAITAKNYNVTIGTALLALNEKPILRVRPAQDQSGKVYDGEEPTAEELAALKIDVDILNEGSDVPPYVPADEVAKAALKILGTPVYTITKEAGVDVGNYHLTITGPVVLKDYNVEYDNTPDITRTYPIKRATYYIVVNNDPTKLGTASKTYGENDPTFTVTAATRTGEGTTEKPYVYTAAAGVTVPNTVRAVHLNNYWGADDAGTHDILVQRNTGSNNRPNWQEFNYGWDTGNYTFYSVRGVFTIAKKAVKFIAVDKSKVYGTADPDLTIAPDPIVTDKYSEALSKTNGVYDAFNISRVIPEGKTGEEVGTYTIKLEVKDVDATQPGIQLHNSLRNYDATVQNGTFTINKATYIVKANDQWIDYGGEINPLDVTITLPNKTLRWQKAGVNETADQTAARVANNALIEALGSLEVLPGKKAIGANVDAYKWTPKASSNYDLATGEAGNFTIAATNIQRAQTYVDGFCNGYLTVYPLTRIPLDMENLAQVLEDHKGLEGITVVMPAREMVEDQWYSWVLPFAVKPSVLFDDEKWGYGAAETLDVTKSTGNNVVFALQVMNPIPANTPFIAKVEEKITADEMKEIEFPVVIADEDADGNEIFYYDYTTGKAVNPTVGTAPNVQFVGLYQDKKGPDETQKFLATTKKTAPQRDFWPGGSKSANFVLVQTEAYLQFNSAVSAANARIFIEDEDGTLTEITGVEADAEVAYGEGWYTINGVKLNAEPTTTGTYIFNGKKVFIQK